jgi:hypothetical protein
MGFFNRQVQQPFGVAVYFKASNILEDGFFFPTFGNLTLFAFHLNNAQVSQHHDAKFKREKKLKIFELIFTSKHGIMFALMNKYHVVDL